MSKSVIYIHGYTGEHGRNPNSSKVQALEAHCKKQGLHFTAPQYPDHDPVKAHDHLTSVINNAKKKDPHPILVGTSLGGFWAHHLSNQHHLPSVIVNPAIDPGTSLKRHADAGRMTQQALRSYSKFKNNHSKPSVVKEHRHVLLEKGDKLLSSEQTRKAYEGNAEVRMFPGGNHQFTRHGEIIKSIDELRHSVSSHGNHND